MIKRYLSYVEIMTKVTSLFAFAMALAYLFFIGQPISWKLTLIFFASMFLFDLTTTAINNYVDTKTNTQDLQFSRKTALSIILIMLFISTVLGLYLAYLTDLVVLAIGGLCFLCGIFYTYGPLPISRQPLGELFSGIFYGLLIPFLLFYMNMPKGTYFTYRISLQSVGITLQLVPLFTVLLLCIAPIATTSNIMLANNICDLEKDIAVKRHTLPYYLDTKACTIFAVSYYLIYLIAVVLVVCKILPLIYLAFLLTLIPVQKNIKQFLVKQEKETTFILSVKNYILIMSSHVFLLFISHWFV